MRYILGLVLLLAACAAKETCISLACLKEEARQTYVRECILTYQDAARTHLPGYVFPYDDPQWQWRHCINEARRLIR